MEVYSGTLEMVTHISTFPVASYGYAKKSDQNADLVHGFRPEIENFDVGKTGYQRRKYLKRSRLVQISAPYSVAPSSEELWVRKTFDQNTLLRIIVQGFRPKTEQNDCR